jgi:CheY-like chemotaxis protein
VLTQRLLAFGRRQVLQPEITALPTLLQGMEDLLRRSIGPSHRLVIGAPATLPPVLVDPGQLELAVLNLALNARDAMPAGGEIAIALRQEALPMPGREGLPPGDYLVLSVTDRGTGMDEATLARAAEPFFTTKGVGKGTGLGLSMAYGLAAQSGGRLALRSRVGEGTVAELWLPRAAGGVPVAPKAEAGATPPAQRRRLHVLVVDDDPLVLTSTAGMLEDLGHVVTEAEGGEQALERLREGAPADLVVTDYGMPGLSGTELAEEIGRCRPGLPVILVTGYGEIPASLAAGVTSLRKPFAQDVLGAAIEAAVRDRR